MNATMTLLVDLFGFLTVILRGLALVLTAGSVGGFVFRQVAVGSRLDAAQTDDVVARLAELNYRTALALIAVMFLAGSLDLLILVTTIEVPWTTAISAPFMVADVVSCIAATILALDSRRTAPRLSTGRWLEWLAAATLIGSIVATTHAMGRLDGRLWLLGVSTLHQIGGAVWIGGLPSFLIVLAATIPGPVRAEIAHRYSHLCVWSVSALFFSATAKYVAYIGVPEAIYGTAYGLMTATKAILFLALIGFGAGNYQAVRRMASSTHATLRTHRFVEVELAIGIGVFFVAGSLTSLPPAVDLPLDRVAWATIVERVLTVKTPRLISPEHSALWYETERVRIESLAADAREQAVRTFVPGAGFIFDRSAADLAWSEYNHNWSGVFVLTIGIFAMLARFAGLRWARHWPVMFVALGIFIAIRSDPETWPLGSIGFFESFRDPSILQHRFMALLVMVFGIFEWRVRAGSLAGTRAAYVFPLTNLLGGILMFTHSHVLENIQEALLIEMSHIPIGLLGIAAGCARWLELRTESPIRERAGYFWPVAFAAIGLVLLFYRES